MKADQPANEKTDRLDRSAEILDRALELGQGERSAYLEGVCAGDLPMRSEIEAMLIAHDEAGEFLAAPTHMDQEATPSVPSEQPGTMIGRYKLLELIGEGGFGQVYVAEQRQPVKRRVALKIIKLGMDTEQVIARFEAERQALAMMDHPNIAKVHDAGATETGRPYFVMELVRGVPITEYCDTEKLDTQSRLNLFTSVCHAIQHAHQKGVIHRDIKPSNVMVTLHDGVPVPKVIDFGIAKATSAELTEKTIYTQHRQMIGTPAYMSPEQAEMSGLDIDTRSDIYSLGVLLYELLTGTTPFDPQRLRSAAYGEIQRIICEEDPEKPSTRVSGLRSEITTQARGSAANKAASDDDPRQVVGQSSSLVREIADQRRIDPASLTRSLRGDLDWIVMKCLEKDRVRRYETANGVAADINRYLHDEPVEASPPTTRYRLQKFVKRNRVGVLAGSAIAAAMVLGVIGTTWGLLAARDQAQIAQREVMRGVEIQRLNTELLGSVNPYISKGFNNPQLRTILDVTAQRLDDGEIEDELVAAELHNVIGAVYRDLGKWNIAERHIPVALEIRTRLLGKEHPDTLQSMHDKIMLDGFLERFSTMEPLLLETLDARKRVLGVDHPDTLTSQDTLAVFYGGQDRIAEAEPLLVETSKVRNRVLGSKHRDTLTSLAHLALLYAETKRIAQAAPLCREVLTLRIEVLGEDHPDTIISMFHLMDVYEKQDRLADAERLRTRATSGARRVWGDEHPYTMRLMRDLGDFYTKLERHEEALAAYQDELNVRRDTQGMQHFMTWDSIRTVGEAFERIGQLEEAEAMYRELLLLLPDSPDDESAVLHALFSIAWVKTREIEGLYEPERAVEIAQRAADIAHTRSLRARHRYLHLFAFAQHQTGDTTEAIKTEEHAISVIPEQVEPVFGPVYEEKLRSYQDALEKKNNDPTDG